MKKKAQSRSKEKDLLWWNIAFLVIIAIVLVYLRASRFSNFFSDGDIFFKDPDTCYHARRIIYVATHHMQMPFYDPLVAHPSGAIPRWSPLYDWLSALPSFIITLGHPSEHLIINIAVILSLLFGLGELFFLGMLVYKATKNLSLAFLSAFLAGIPYPQIKYSSMETLDHNSLMLLLFSALLYVSYLLMSKDAPANSIKLVLSISVLIASLFWTWTGSYVYIVLLACIHFLYAVIRKKYWLFSLYARCYCIAGLLTSPLAYIHYRLGKAPLKFGYISLFTVLFLIEIGAGFYLFGCISVWKSNAHKKILLIKTSASFVLLILVIGYLLSGISGGARVATGQNIWVSTLAESKPLFYLASGPIKIFTFQKAFSFFGYLILIFPIAFLLVAFRVIKIPFSLYLIILLNSLMFGFLMLFQQKIAAEFSLAYGIMLALFIGWLYTKITNKFSIILALIFVLLIAISFTPLKENLIESNPEFNAYYYGFKWLKEELNLKDTEINTGHAQELGAMAPWDLGHHLEFYDIPSVADNFGMSVEPFAGFYDMARFFLSENEDDAVSILKKYKCQYIVVPFFSMFEHYPLLLGLDSTLYYKYMPTEKDGKKHIAVEPSQKFFHTLGFRLSYLYGSQNPLRNPKTVKFEALRYFRLVYEAPELKVHKKTVSIGSLKIYQYVKGAELIINESGSSFYQLEAPIVTNTGNQFFYRDEGYLNNHIIVPYSTEKHKTYSYALSYKIFVNGKLYEFTNIPEKEIK